MHTRLEVRVANDTPIPYSGFMELEFSFLGEQGISTIMVPFLVKENVLENPIMGYNVIEEIVKNQSVVSENYSMEESDSSNLVLNTMVASFHKKTEALKALVSFMKCSKDAHTI